MRLKTGNVPPNLIGAAELRQRAAARAWASGGRLHWLVQFAAEPDEELLERLGWQDVRVLQYVPEQALLVSAPAEIDWAAAGSHAGGAVSGGKTQSGAGDRRRHGGGGGGDAPRCRASLRRGVGAGGGS